MNIIRKINQSSAGFTLIELLVAATITSIVVSLTGFGMVSISERNKQEKVETERRVEINRALDFIAEEVRMAKKVELNAETATVADFEIADDATNVQKILVLEVPASAGVRKVVYYIASLKDDPDPSKDSVWSGPKVIYRWGPGFDGDGKYTGTNDDDNQNKVLVDFIDDSTPPTNPDCPASWLPNPSVNDRKGFYACVDPNGKLAELYLHGKLTNAYGDPRTPLAVSTKAFPRPYEIALGGPVVVDPKDLADKLAAEEEAKKKAATDTAIAAAEDAKKKAEDAQTLAKKAKDAADIAANEYTKAKDEVDQLKATAKEAADTAAKQQTSAAYKAAEEAAKKYANAEKVAAEKAAAAETAADNLIDAYNDAATAATEYADAAKAAAELDTQNAGEYNQAAEVAQNKATEYTTAAQGVTNYNATEHTNTAKIAGDKATFYETAATKYATAEQKATEYAAAKQNAESLAQVASAAAKDVSDVRTSTAYNTAAQAYNNYAAAERAAASKAEAAQAALNDAVKYATSTEAATKYAAAPHITAAQAADQLAYQNAAATKFTTSGGTITMSQPSAARFEILGGSMDCPGKGEIPTTTTINSTPQGGTTTSTAVPSSTKALNLLANTGAKITISGYAQNSWCVSGYPNYTFNSEQHKNTQVWTLRNGDTPPPFAPYGTQAKIDAFLKNYLDSAGKVKLAANQVIYLFELFTTNIKDSTYDMQDIVVLANIELTPICTVPNVVGMNTNSGDGSVQREIKNKNFVPSGTKISGNPKKVQSQLPLADEQAACGSTVSYTYKQ